MYSDHRAVPRLLTAVRTRSTSTGEPPHIAMRLANDDDVRVRRALAEAVADALTPTTRTTDHGTRGALAQVRDLLLDDPSFRVRTGASGANRSA